MSLEPPPFQEASRCDVCKCSFNTFRRRHHCRCCGRTLCAEHSSTQMALPQFGLQSLVRVCSDCYNDASRKKDDTQASLSTVNNVSDSISRLDIRAVAEPESKLPIKQLDVLECTCGMPLCICEAPAPAPVPIPARDVSGVTSSSTFQSNTKPKKSDSKPRSRGSASNSNLGPASNSSSNSLESNKLYEVNGEGLREAIKNGDTVAVRKLLSEMQITVTSKGCLYYIWLQFLIRVTLLSSSWTMERVLRARTHRGKRHWIVLQLHSKTK
ncbi:vacuolar protein sorting-associated protein 27 isoform X2 [Daucus carota subsp. sativus]|uniref:vacuolar protein sorting-associated protein 27 isoform X2 n=1 Tax=Daucus carota subsp. sativus TaxID=79200 RepID=UPI0007EF139A|nr:PREDICTED: vacuolar protein sorting-associated protein 27-like isoform X2 [Daucus carota subsp. sativus]